MDIRHPSKANQNLILVVMVMIVISVAYFFIWHQQTPADNYVLFFKQANEPDLAKLNNNQSSIRLIHDYGHKIDIIRITKIGNDIKLRGICFYHDTFPDRFDVVYDSSIPVKIQQWDELISAVSKDSVWQLATRNDNRGGLDGEVWVLEIKLGKAYKVVNRWSPDCNPPMSDLITIDKIISKIANYDFYAFSQPNHPLNPDAASSRQRPRQPL